MTTTNPNYWDCECEENYIHPKGEQRCAVCGEWQVDMPDSHATEIPKDWNDPLSPKNLEAWRLKR